MVWWQGYNYGAQIVPNYFKNDLPIQAYSTVVVQREQSNHFLSPRPLWTANGFRARMLNAIWKKSVSLPDKNKLAQAF